jgi:hypothetical protein
MAQLLFLVVPLALWHYLMLFFSLLLAFLKPSILNLKQIYLTI